MKQPLMAVTNLRHPTKSEEISMRKLVTAGAFVLISIGAAPAVQAHEFRSFGNGYSVFLGSYVEPAFAGFENGIDIFPAYSYTAFDGSQQTYLVDTGAGDTFNFTTSEILYSNNPLPIIHTAADIPPGTRVIDTLVPHGRVNPTLIEEKFGSANLKFSASGPEYNNHFLPKKPGFYGFHIAGTIQVKASNIAPGAGGLDTQGVPGTNNAPPLVSFSGYFICGNGSQDAPRTAFGCVDQILSVPRIEQDAADVAPVLGADPSSSIYTNWKALLLRRLGRH
jgi:hypothetical protein